MKAISTTTTYLFQVYQHGAGDWFFPEWVTLGQPGNEEAAAETLREWRENDDRTARIVRRTEEVLE